MSTNLANAVSTSREALGWSIRELATRAGISTGNVCRIESGDDTTIKMAEKIAAAFGIELISLLNLAKALEKPSTELKKLEVEMREMALRMINGLGPKEK